MKVANLYNHLNAREFLIVNKKSQYQEILKCIESIDVTQFLKLSCEVKKLGEVLYSQTQINKAFKQILNNCDWKKRKIFYYVTGDERITRDIIGVHDKHEQKRIIENHGQKSYRSNNEVDFQKDRIAVEVQFGKYFSVAYDLHVKHTFFYARNDIDVGIEIIPTKQLQEHMDSGVSWFENEVTNVIREGRTNPPVPILILGIEPEEITSGNPMDYDDDEYLRIILNSDMDKLREKIHTLRRKGNINTGLENRIEKIERCFAMIGRQ